jgi:hypothetical protein
LNFSFHFSNFHYCTVFTFFIDMILPPCLIQVPLLWTLAATLPTSPPPTTLLPIVPEVASSIVSGSRGSSSSSNTHSTHTAALENYWPRRLYPGTYQNYCGPTPEITVGDDCRAHGWHGDEARDEVDAVCRLHDISYCSCEAALLSRQHKVADEQIPGLSSLIALRFVTLPAAQTLLHLDQAVIDDDYLDCIHQADVHLIATGITIRRQQQQSNCDDGESSSPSTVASTSSSVSSSSAIRSVTDDSSSTTSSSSSKLKWFCQLNGDEKDSTANTLSAFEKVSLAIFLRNLDFDFQQQQQQQKSTNTVFASSSNSNNNDRRLLLLTQLEAKRQEDFRAELKRGKTIAAAMASPEVQRDEQEMLHVLLQQQQIK